MGDASPGAAAAVAGTAAAVALAAPDAAKTDPKGLEPEKAARPGAPRPAAGGPGVQGGPSGEPMPPEGMARDRKTRRSAEAPPPRPPKVVRDVLKALGF